MITHANDIDLYYEEHGTGDPLLLVMGLGTDSSAWMFQVPAFQAHYRVIAFDNRGVGRSTKPAGPYTISQMADDAAALLHAVGITRTHVLGISMGGMIAQELALRHPQRVRSLVLGCTFAAPDDTTLAFQRASAEQLGGRVAADGSVEIDVSNLNPMTFFQMLMPMVFNQGFIEKELPTLMQLFSGALAYGFSMDALLSQVAAVTRHNTLDRLGSITVPTLVITGDADRLVPPQHSDVLATRIPGARLVKIPGGSHAFNFETPDLFNREVLEFLASVRT